MARTTIHLMRHGEVHNPEGILYGRLPGYHLSELGRQMALQVADVLSASGHDIAAVITSPLERARETGAPTAAAFDLTPTTDVRLIEAGNHFEGVPVNRNRWVLAHPEHWRYYLNPLRPSWGEPYAELVARMRAAVRDAIGVGHHCHVNSDVPYDPSHPEPELDADRLMQQSAVVLRLGSLMLASGAGSYRVKSSMAKAASAVGLDRHEATVTMTELVTSSFVGERFRTETCEVRRVGVNVDRLEALRRIVHDLRAHETVEHLDRKLDEIEGRHALYGGFTNAAASGVACAGFCFLNQGGWVECSSVLIAAFIGQFMRRQMLKRQYQHFFTWMVCGVIASGVYMGIVSLLHIFGIVSGDHQGGIISAILFLIPGFPMVTSMLDLARQDFSSALSRAAYVLVVMASAGVAVWTVTFLFHWEVESTNTVVPNDSNTIFGLHQEIKILQNRLVFIGKGNILKLDDFFTDPTGFKVYG